jgi:hypothetical protein
MGYPLGLLFGSTHFFVAQPFDRCPALTPRADLLKLTVSEMFNSYEGVLDRPDPDKLVKLHLDRCAIPILRVLDQEDHEESDDRRAGVDHQLPCVGILKDWACDCPYHDYAHSYQERQCSSGCL